jgi:invasion protein IalB
MISITQPRIAMLLGVAAVLVLPSAALAQQGAAKQGGKPQQAAANPSPSPGGGQPTLLGQYGDWGAYTANSSGRKVCYALAKPTSSQTTPPNRPRDPAYMFVSTRPAEHVKNEISVIVGYPQKPNADASMDVGGAKFAMYTQNDGAWIKNAAEESRLIEAMRKGSEATVTGTSSRGTVSTDRYSLKGLTQALDRVAQECK